MLNVMTFYAYTSIWFRGNNSNVSIFGLQQPRYMHIIEPEQSSPSTSIHNLINSERIPSEQALGLNAHEASILNFLRVDAAEKQRDRRYSHIYIHSKFNRLDVFHFEFGRIL